MNSKIQLIWLKIFSLNGSDTKVQRSYIAIPKAVKNLTNWMKFMRVFLFLIKESSKKRTASVKRSKNRKKKRKEKWDQKLLILALHCSVTKCFVKQPTIHNTNAHHSKCMCIDFIYYRRITISHTINLPLKFDLKPFFRRSLFLVCWLTLLLYCSC